MRFSTIRLALTLSLLLAPVVLAAPPPVKAPPLLQHKGGIRFEPLSQSRLSQLLQSVQRRFEEDELRTISLRTPAGEEHLVASGKQESDLQALPLQALRVARSVDCVERLHQEIDMLVPLSGSDLFPVTARCVGMRALVPSSAE